MSAIPIDVDEEDPEELRRQPMKAIPLPGASNAPIDIATGPRRAIASAADQPMEIPQGVIGSTSRQVIPMNAAPRPQVMSSGGIPVTPQAPHGIIPTDAATGQPTPLNNKGIPIKAGLAGLWAKADNIHNPVLRVLGKIGTGALRAIDVAGQIASPRLESAIPGSAGYEQRQIAGRQATDSQNSKTGLEDAQTAHLNAETATAGQPKPKEESWEVTPHFTGPNGEPVEVEKNSGTMRVGGTEVPGIKGVQKETPDKPAHITYDSGIPVSVTDAKGKTYDVNDPKLPPELKPLVDSANRAHKQHLDETKKPEVEPGTWQLAEQDGKSVMFNSKTGEVKAAPAGLGKPGTAAKAEQKTAGAKTALAYATDYGSRSAHTGPGDEALMEKFFELAKPETGFRMTQSQIDMLKQSQGWMDSFEAKARHATSGTWFSNDQRSQIVQTMKDLAKANGLDESGEKWAAPKDAPAAPAEDGHQLKKDGKVIATSRGGKWVKP